MTYRLFSMGGIVMSILQTENLRKIYGAGDTEVRALDGISLFLAWSWVNLLPLIS